MPYVMIGNSRYYSHLTKSEGKEYLHAQRESPGAVIPPAALASAKQGQQVSVQVQVQEDLCPPSSERTPVPPKGRAPRSSRQG